MFRRWRAKRRIYKKLEYLDDYSEDNVKNFGPLYARVETKRFGLGFAREYTPPFRNGRGIVFFRLHLGIWIRTGIKNDEEGNLWAMRGSRINEEPERIAKWGTKNGKQESNKSESLPIKK